MSISTRISIAWAPSFTHSEPTSTLVLTGKTYFVDQRLSPSLDSVSWAFAGTRSSQPIPNRPGFSKCSWTHLTTSVPSSPSDIPVDEGILGPHPDYPDDPEVALETGAMKHPHTGIVTEYQEVWRDKDAKEGEKVVFWSYGEDGSGHDRGFVGQVAGYALGVGNINGEFWTWRAEMEGFRWKVIFETGRRMGFALLDLGGVVPGVVFKDSEISGRTSDRPPTTADRDRSWVCKEAYQV